MARTRLEVPITGALFIDPEARQTTDIRVLDEWTAAANGTVLSRLTP